MFDDLSDNRRILRFPPIIKPGRLTDDPATARVALAPELPKGEIPRADVAVVLAEVLETPELDGYEFDLVAGEMPVSEAVKNVARVAGE